MLWKGGKQPISYGFVWRQRFVGLLLGAVLRHTNLLFSLHFFFLITEQVHRPNNIASHRYAELLYQPMQNILHKKVPLLCTIFPRQISLLFIQLASRKQNHFPFSCRSPFFFLQFLGDIKLICRFQFMKPLFNRR